jgi:glycosyltransferase involved in cell wall biosynthesis
MKLSVIIPVYNGGENFRRCLEALWASSYADWECIVVDDGSDDGSDKVAQSLGAVVIHSERPKSGPASARNLAVQRAQGEILFFIDSDILVRPGTLAHVAAVIADETISACIGSYDDAPTAPNFLSQYRNLLHHYTHQHSNREAATFWSGCGAVRRDIFTACGGFSTTFARPSIEDIELGYRLRAKGHRIILEKELQVGHMKRWTAAAMLVTDIRDRAIPWARLMLAGGVILDDLNLAMSQRVSSAVALTGGFSLFLSLLFPWMLALTSLSALVLVILNRPFYSFLREKRGFIFALLALPWHWLYFIYSGLSFGVCYLWFHTLNLIRRRLSLAY